VLALAPTPKRGRQLTRAAVRRALVVAGRRRNLLARVVVVHDALAGPQLAAPEPVEGAYRPGGGRARATLGCLNEQVTAPGAAARLPVRHPPGRRDSAKPARAWGGAGRAGAGRVRRRPAPLWRRQGPQVARRHRPGHPILGAAHRGGRPGGVQAAAGGRLLPVGVRGALASPGARRCYDAHRAPRRQPPPPGATSAGQPVGRHLARLPGHRVTYQEQLAWPAAERAT
jgi:hypothetical protein